MDVLDSVPVLVVDDSRPFRVAAAAVLRRTPGFVLAGEATSGAEAVEQAIALRPALVLMDIRMPGMDGIAATAALTAQLPSAVVVLCSTYAREDLPPGALDTGAVAYLHKEELRPSVLRALWDEFGATPLAAPSPG